MEVEMPLFMHETTGEKCAMAVLTPAKGLPSIHFIRFTPTDGPPGAVLSDNRTLCGKYTGNPVGCRVELMTQTNAPDDATTCDDCKNYGGEN